MSIFLLNLYLWWITYSHFYCATLLPLTFFDFIAKQDDTECLKGSLTCHFSLNFAIYSVIMKLDICMVDIKNIHDINT